MTRSRDPPTAIACWSRSTGNSWTSGAGPRPSATWASPSPGGGPRSAAAALPRLEAAIAARPDDLLAYQAEGTVLGRLGRLADGLAAFRAALARAPDTESTLAGAANLADRLGRRYEAIADVRRAIAKSPWRAVYHANLAAFCFDARDWRGAIAAARDALRLNPMDLESRKRLVRALLHAGDQSAAREEFRILLDFDPPDRAELFQRFPTLR
jgi:protein O-GlcNAc transferase